MVFQARLQASGQTRARNSGHGSGHNSNTRWLGVTDVTEITILFINMVWKGVGAAHLVCNSEKWRQVPLQAALPGFSKQCLCTTE